MANPTVLPLRLPCQPVLHRQQLRQQHRLGRLRDEELRRQTLEHRHRLMLLRQPAACDAEQVTSTTTTTTTTTTRLIKTKQQA